MQLVSSTSHSGPAVPTHYRHHFGADPAPGTALHGVPAVNVQYIDGGQIGCLDSNGIHGPYYTVPNTRTTPTVRRQKPSWLFQDAVRKLSRL